MSIEQAYPPIEHYEFPKSVEEILSDELRFSQSEGETAKTITLGLGRMYGWSELLQACQRIAILVHAGQVPKSERRRVSGMDDDFYAGEILGVHSLYQVLDRPTRTQVIRVDFSRMFGIGPGTSMEEYDNTLNEVIKGVVRFRRGAWKEQLGWQSPALQDILGQIALRMYENQENAEGRKDGFMAGYLFASNLVIGLVQPSQSHD